MRPALTSIAFTLLVCAGAASLLAGSGSALAQGGPPLVTDDPDTPGNGRWEINLATIATHTAGRWSVAAPDADINFGCGDAVQLTAEIPWTLVTESGCGWDAGLGSAQLGVKWRFLDHPDL